MKIRANGNYASFHTVSWMMIENDTLYFNMKDNYMAGNSLLVIDVRVNKIQSTYYEAGNVKDIFDYPYGVRQIELAILEYLDNHDETFQEGKKKILTFLEDDKEGYRRCLKTCREYIRSQIEDFYTSDLKLIDLSLPIRKLIGRGPNFLLDCEIDKLTLEDTILKEYKVNLRNEFSRVAMQVSPQVIVLTGETLRMPWLCYLIKDVFSEAYPSVKVYKNFNPNHKVSDSIKKYALARAKFEKSFEEATRRLWNEYTDKKLEEVVQLYFNETLNEIRFPLIQKFMIKWMNGEIKDSSGHRSPMGLLKYFNDLNSKLYLDYGDEIRRIFSIRINTFIQNTFVREVNQIFKDCYGVSQPNKLLPPNLELRFVGLKTNLDIDRERLESLADTVYGDSFFYGAMDRDISIFGDRLIFYDKMMDAQKSRLEILPEKNLTAARDTLKGCITEYLEEVKRHPPFITYE